jgi:hypothetical protein
MMNGGFDAKTKWVKNYLESIDFVMGVDQEGFLLISICK